jgi:integral membrane sensor domain MASE1
MAGLKAANLGLKFLLELAAIAAFAYWGASHSPVILALLLAIAIPAAFAAAWGIWAAPRSARRLRRQPRVAFELGCFALASVALIAAGATVAGIAYAVVAAVNAVLLAAFGQLEA